MHFQEHPAGIGARSRENLLGNVRSTSDRSLLASNFQPGQMQQRAANCKTEHIDSLFLKVHNNNIGKSNQLESTENTQPTRHDLISYFCCARVL